MCREIHEVNPSSPLPFGSCAEHGQPGKLREEHWPECGLNGQTAPIVCVRLLCPTEDSWLEERRKRVGASDSPIILGASSFSSRVRLYAEKVGDLAGWGGSEKTEMGHRMEPYILEMVAADLGATDWTHYGSDEGTSIHASTRWGFLACTLDGELTVEGVRYQAEVKNTDRWEDWTEGPPAAYWIQCQHQMAVTGERRMLLCVLGRGWILRWAWVDRDDTFILGTLVPECEAFMGNVERRELPPVDASDHTRRALAALFPDATKGEQKALPGEFIDLSREYDVLVRQAAVLGEQIEAIKNRVRAALGTAEYGSLPDGSGWSWTGKNGRRALRRREANNG